MLSELPLNTSITPQDLEDEELLAYAEEYAALADFDDVNGEEWSLSELEDDDSAPLPDTGNADVDVVMS